MTRTTVGYFRDRASADAAYDDLTRSGFSRDEISIMGRGRDGGKGIADDHDHDHDHVGAGEGAAVGGITGLLLGAAAMLIPGIGPIVAVGPLAAGIAGALTGGATGVVVGGITGALTDAGVDHDTAEYYDQRFRQGGYLLTVRADDMEYEKARMILERHDGDVRAGTAGASTTEPTAPRAAMGTAATTSDTDRSMHLKEERLRAEKETVQAGEVGLRKEVVSEQRTMDVPVTREEVVVERHPVTGDRPATGDIREGEEIRVPVREEQVRVEKYPVVTEEVSVGKRPVTETERVSGTIRKEEARVETSGDVQVGNTQAATTGMRGTTHEHRWTNGRCLDCDERQV